MKIVNNIIVLALFMFGFSTSVFSAKLALVIDDFGYHQENETKIILLSPNITVAVLPNSPHAQKMASLSHEHGNDVIIHLPMAPIGKQPLEVDTLTPSMSRDEVHQIVGEAIEKVPYAIGMNNHMGSFMTSSLDGMNKVMESLSHYSLFFLDSRTIAKSQAIYAANNYRVATVSRDVFLDDSQDEQSVSHQFDLAIKLARKNGQAVAIGHPYNSTLKVLNEKLSQLPDDIELVKVSSLVIYPEKIKIKNLIDAYKIKFEQNLFEYMIIKESR